MCLSALLGATSLKAPTDLRLGGPLHRQQPNRSPTHPLTLRLKESAFQHQSRIWSYPHFRKVIPDQRADYRRVTEQFAGLLRGQDLHG